MRVTIQLPDDISAALAEQWDDVPRGSLEAIAVEAYRTGALTEVDVRSVPPETLSTISEDLDLCEWAAIALAETTHADLLLIDEAAGRAEAKRRHLRVTGTLGRA